MADVPRRMERVNQLLREEVAKYLQEHYSHENLGLLTVVGATVSTDLKNATVFVSVLGDGEQQKVAVKVLNDAAYQIRHGIKRFLSLKTIPNLKFELDQTAAYADRIERLLRGAPLDVVPGTTPIPGDTAGKKPGGDEA